MLLSVKFTLSYERCTAIGTSLTYLHMSLIFFVHIDLAALEFFRAKKDTYILVSKEFTFCEIMIEQEIV